jgi:membrane protease YdiL (CAAX protease family)
VTDDPRAQARAAGKAAVVAFAAVLVLVTALVRVDVEVPLVGHLGSALVAVIFLYAPSVVAWRRHEHLDDYGFHAAPLARGLGYGVGAVVVIFPLFVAGYFVFYGVVCHSELLRTLAPGGACRVYRGFAALHAPHLDRSFGEFVAVQAIVVALPEELFFRGCLLRLLEQRFPPRRRILGGGVGIALVLSAAAFALIHLPKDGDPRALATFFPGLLFGWMRSATGSILASTIAHASSNILIRVLDLSLLR